MRHYKDGKLKGRIFFKRWSLEYVLGRIQFGIGYSPYEHHSFHVLLPLIGLYVNWGIANHDRELTISVHNWAIWWNLWTSGMDWDSKTPRWRHGCWDILDAVLGKNTYFREVIEERDVEIPMPEGCYPAHVKLCKDTWKRPRGITRTITRIDADIPKGIPHEGKGENAYDCGTDGCFGMCCPARSITDGVGKIVGSVLKDRIKYGGWKDWKWNKKEGK
jgi:hypothetical protein